MDKEMLLQQLLDACRQGRQGAIRLARHARAEPLRSLLAETARQYGRAAAEISTAWKSGAPQGVASSPARARLEAHAGDDLVASWERAECETLTYFRDAYDGGLEQPLADTVKRHYEAGLTRLERLRTLERRQGRA